MDIGEFVVFAIVFFCVICLPVIIHEKRKSPEQKREEQERFAQNRAALAEQYRADREARKIVEVKLLGGGSTTYKRGGLGGAAFGGFIGGAPGAIVGAVLPSGKGVQKQKFAVKYANGEVAVREYAPGTSEYKELMKYVKWEDISE